MADRTVKEWDELMEAVRYAATRRLPEERPQFQFTLVSMGPDANGGEPMYCLEAQTLDGVRVKTTPPFAMRHIKVARVHMLNRVVDEVHSMANTIAGMIATLERKLVLEEQLRELDIADVSM